MDGVDVDNIQEQFIEASFFESFLAHNTIQFS